MRPSPGLRPVLFLLFFHLCSALLYAQATAAASRKFSASAFTGVSIVHTDREGTLNTGFSFGGDIGYFLPGGFVPALEVRVKLAPGTYSENTYGGGVRLQHRFSRTDLYGNFLWNYGSITVPATPTPTHDNSTVYSPGGGVDFLITDTFAARIDYQYEYWHTGNAVSFNPQTVTFGVVYRLGFRPYLSH
jgi:hypothetical protein